MSRVVTCGERSAGPVGAQRRGMAGGIVHEAHTFSASGVHGALTVRHGSGINRPVLAAKYTRRVCGALLVGGGGFRSALVLSADAHSEVGAGPVARRRGGQGLEVLVVMSHTL